MTVIAKAAHIVRPEGNAALEIQPCEGLALQTGSSPPRQRRKHVGEVYGVPQLTSAARKVDSGGSCVGCHHAPHCSIAQPCRKDKMTLLSVIGEKLMVKQHCSALHIATPKC